MSGIIGHTTYALLALKAAKARKLPVTGVLERHLFSYLAGAYIGCDVQTMPAAICNDTGEGVGHGPAPISVSPLTGGTVRAFKLKFEDREIAPREIHDTFYGRSHLILGFRKEDSALQIPLAQLLDYAADVAGDAVEIFGPGERPLAYVFGWLTHVAGDGLIKSVLDGINLNLLDGKYTPKNRPIQDLISFNDIGIDELGLNWPALLDDLASTPVEPVQIHYMRCGRRQGKLGAHFEEGWNPDHEALVRTVLAENRRYQRVRNPRLIKQMTLTRKPNGESSCHPDLSRLSGGMSYFEMQEAAREANFRHALWQMGEIISDIFERVIDRETILQSLPQSTSPDWEKLTKQWSK